MVNTNISNREFEARLLMNSLASDETYNKFQPCGIVRETMISNNNTQNNVNLPYSQEGLHIMDLERDREQRQKPAKKT